MVDGIGILLKCHGLPAIFRVRAPRNGKALALRVRVGDVVDYLSEQTAAMVFSDTAVHGSGRVSIRGGHGNIQEDQEGYVYINYVYICRIRLMCCLSLVLEKFSLGVLLCLFYFISFDRY